MLDQPSIIQMGTNKVLRIIKKREKKRPVGRPKRENKAANEAAMALLTNGFLMDSRSSKVGEKIIAVALDDEPPRQGVAMKIWADRALHVDNFAKAAGQAGKSAVQINITGVNMTDMSNSSVIDGESSEILQD